MDPNTLITDFLITLFVVNSCVAFAVLSFVQQDGDRFQVNSLRFFKTYFICASLGYLAHVYRAALPFEASVAATNLFLLASGYCVVYGLLWRYKQQQRLSNSLVITHLAVFTLVQGALSYFYPDYMLPRLALIYINLPAVLLYALSLFSRFKLQQDNGFRALKTAIGVVALNIVLIPIFFFSADSEAMYLNWVLLSQNITQFFMFAGLLYASFADRLQQYKQHVSIDRTTSLLNRDFFLNQARGFLHAAERHQFPISIVICELDKFADVSHDLGHIERDSVIADVAKVIKHETRLEDLVARFSSDTFAVLLPQTRANGATLIAERMRAEVEDMQLTVDGAGLQLTASFGVTSIEHSMDIDASLKQVDRALRAAKLQGGNQVQLYQP